MGLKDIYDNSGIILQDEFVYTSIDEVSLDIIPEGYLDGDSALLEHYESLGGIPQTAMQRVEQAQRNADANLRLMLNQKVVVPLPRLLKLKQPNMHGKDVIALQRALAKAKLRKWGNFTGFYGSGTKHQVAEFQEKMHLRRDGQYGLETHKKLARYYDAYGTFLMNQANKQFAKNSPRDTIVSYSTFGFNNRYKIHYTQGPLRMYGVRNHVRPPRIPYYEDCSSYATWTYWGAGVRDPNGLGYNGWGYTGTLAQHGSRTTNPQPGDLAFYGRFPYGHVVVYIGNGKCISHGSEIGPLLLNVYYRSDFSHFRTYV